MSKLKDIPKVDRPREKFLKKGPDALSKSDLLAIFLGSGIKGKNVQKLSQQIIKKFGKNFLNITVNDLQKVSGIGQAKALQIASAISLVKRFYADKKTNEIIIKNSQDVLSLTYDLKDKKKEYLVCLYLNARNVLLKKEIVSVGLLDKTLLHPREIFYPATELNAASVILIHNHPSGDSSPSKKDIQVVKKIAQAGEIMGIPVIDFVIISENGHHSFCEKLKGKNESLDYFADGEQVSLFDYLEIEKPVYETNIEKKNNISDKPTYISLFSGAGVGCYGFKLENFNCISTVEILEKRLNIQRCNDKCLFEAGYICGDIRKENIKQKLRKNIQYFSKNLNKKNLDVLIATPPCQGMSVANHKKQNELGRNSLVIESIKLTKEFFPKFFIFENVSAFLNTICTDIDGKDKKIGEAIENNFSGQYNILSKVINFKNYGNNSSRTRTIVIGIRKDQKHVTPLDLFPKLQEGKTLYEVIGDLPPLKEMGEICSNDIYHQFKKYSSHMREWICCIQEGESAFDNKDKTRIPHRIVNEKIVYNQNKNGDKYKKQLFNKVAPCIHTRNDILSSQNTVHPKDDRVFSIRELMRMMTIPENFRWSHHSNQELNKFSLLEKQLYFKKEEMNIRHSIGEAVPTNIFRQIAKNIRNQIFKKNITQSDMMLIIEKNNLQNIDNLKGFIEENKQNLDYSILLKIAEFSNTKRNDNAAYYTTQDIVYSIVKNLPDSKNYKNLSILEPSVGIGAFLPVIIKKYIDVENVVIDVVDIDNDSIKTLKILLEKIKIPNNIKINFINDDFLKHDFSNKYDIVIGNPPFGKIIKNKNDLNEYLQSAENKKTSNIFSFFIEKSLKIGKIVSLIVPKSLLSSPEFNKTREILSKYYFKDIIDYGETGFKGVKIETISFTVDTSKKSNKENFIKIESFINNEITFKKQTYIFDESFPYWLIYRNDFFDNVSNKLIFNIFFAFRDRQITKKHTQQKGRIRVLKSRNIGSNKIINKDGYDCYIDDLEPFPVKKFLNNDNLILVPNLTYNPRACFLPKNTIADGSVAILSLRNDKYKITEKDLEYFNTEEFSKFYSIARNRGTRSLNIDNNSVFYFGKLKD